MTDQSPAAFPWDDEAVTILERHCPPDLRSRLRAEIEHLAKARGEEKVSLDTLLSIEELITGG